MIVKKKVEGTKQSCCCSGWQAACQYKPGWFLPGEAEKVADYLEMSLVELFRTKLAVDWWAGDPDIFLLSPAIVGRTGVEFPANPCGVCVFFKDGLCAIHPVKPFECAEAIHDEERTRQLARHAQVGKAWQLHQDQIRMLLGREPRSANLNIFDAMRLSL